MLLLLRCLMRQWSLKTAQTHWMTRQRQARWRRLRNQGREHLSILRLSILLRLSEASRRREGIPPLILSPPLLLLGHSMPLLRPCSILALPSTFIPARKRMAGRRRASQALD